MLELLITAAVCIYTWMTVRELRKPRKKRKAKQANKAPLIARWFGYPVWLWLAMKFNPNVNYDEILLTLQHDQDAKTVRYVQRASGLWVPSE